ncbi:MAG TPA: hypothetical protein VHP63_00040 [candidate division Zixibacteria bacterium]|nr:hypothetical protein [candidate division Zixibacteria bacterium]
MNKAALIIAASLILFGCGSKSIYNQPGSENSGYYETAWIDPKVVLEDPWYTLMKSHRVDSFYVSSDKDNPNPSTKSIKLEIKNYECLAVVNLLDGNSQVVRPLMAKTLGPGYYKLTVNSGQLLKEKLPPGNYYLKAEYCGSTVIQDLGWL